jgi:hypothetical protein
MIAMLLEMIALVFSGEAWNFVWMMIENDVVHSWGLDFIFTNARTT